MQPEHSSHSFSAAGLLVLLFCHFYLFIILFLHPSEPWPGLWSLVVGRALCPLAGAPTLLPLPALQAPPPAFQCFCYRRLVLYVHN